MRPLPNKTGRGSYKQPKIKATAKTLVFLLVSVLVIGVYSAYAILRPLPSPKTTITPPVIPALVKVAIPWPTAGTVGQAAYGADGYGVLATYGSDTPSPTASTTKLITAMSVLAKKPLKPGEEGPLITISAADAALVASYQAKDGSVVPVTASQTISEHKILEAVLMASANNLSDTLAIWAFGSMQAYTTFANEYVKTLGMKHTTVTDASGFAPTTVSTAADLVRLGDAVLDNPVLTKIVSQKTTDFPGVGTISSTNKLLGQAGIIGMKTGNTDEAGGCYIAVANVDVAGTTVRVITAVMKAPTIGDAMRLSLPLIQASPSQFQLVHAVDAGQTIGKATTPWGSSSDIIADRDISVVAWSGTTIPALTSESSISVPSDKNATVGRANLTFQGKRQTTNLKLASELSAPSIWWRLTHPL